MMLLELEDVNAYYGKSQILHGLSLEVDSDEIIALLGRNGVGKTTTMRSIMGVVPHAEGDIRFDGESIVGCSPDEVFNRGISWVPESRRIFTNLTVEENLRMGERRKTDTKNGYERVFRLFPRLEERLEQIAGTLSGGEQQMLSIGRALLSDPSLLLIDEPFEGLMPSLVSDLEEILAGFRDEDISILVAGQRADATLGLVDRVYVLDNGNIEFSGDVDEIAGDEELQKKYLGVR